MNSLSWGSEGGREHGSATDGSVERKNAKQSGHHIQNLFGGAKKKSAWDERGAAQGGGEPKHSAYLAKFLSYLSGEQNCIIMKGEGLTVKDGRLINDRPVGESGIAQAARLRRNVKRGNQASIIAEGIELSEMRKGFRLM